MAKFSTGLRTQMLDTDSFKNIMDGGLIKIYAGAAPADADAAIGSATLLCTISNNSTGTGLNFDTAATAAVIAKDPTQVWSGVNAASGTAVFFRHVASGDTGVASATQARIQGSISTIGADLNLSSTALVSGATQTIDYYPVLLPTM